ncbi:Polycomb protein mes-3 [Caenorhabditis elegans]|uniref:Polycomb protein mes-3 n=1 Tax=Caenorhabditis elegans TaxID=6239 RepID=G8JY65_CAEEL|nr:Polycomb protein mes-3 [Caenorhabditis elegans]CCD67545.2 Polycomb protein mes-3 [Caenorhabditis elegans]
MTPATAEVKVGGRKRKNDEPVFIKTKQSRSARREEEKENLLNKSLPSTPTSSEAGSSRESSNPVTSSSRRKNPPTKLENIQKTLPTCSDGLEIRNYVKKYGLPEDNKFLVRNVFDKQLLFGKKYVCRRRVIKSIDEFFPRLKTDAHRENGLYNFCTLQFMKISSWGSSMDEKIYVTSAAIVQSYVIIVDDNDSVTCIENGISVIPMANRTLPSISYNSSNVKNITLTGPELKKAKNVYLAVIVKRKTPKLGENRVGTRGKSTRASFETAASSENFQQLVRFGCTLMYDKDAEINCLNDGVQRIILLDREEKPAYLKIFGKADEPELENAWMNNVKHLEFISDTNYNKEDSHLARLIFSSNTHNYFDRPDISKFSPWQPRSRRTTLKSGTITLKQLLLGTKKLCGRRKRHLTRLTSRWPCFSVDPTKINSYFNETGVTLLENSCSYRPGTQRSIPIKPTRVIRVREETPVSVPIEVITIEDDSDDSPCFSARNRAPGGTRKYGLDFIQSSGHMPYIRYVYMNRANDLVPQLNGEENGKIEGLMEAYPMNNAHMYSDIEFLRKEKLNLPKNAQKYGEMTILDYPLTKTETDEYNKKMSVMNVKDFAVKPRKPIPTVGNTTLSLDLEGCPISTFSEIFFPSGKTELFNILCRHFYSEAGQRPGCFSAQWKSRVLTGFINKYHQYIFDMKLNSLFEKQINLIAMVSPDWKLEDFELPMVRYKQLKKEWKNRQRDIPSSN